jgi:transposase
MVAIPKKPCKELTTAQKSRIWTLYEEGYNPTEIWHKTKIRCTTCSTFITRQSTSPNPSFEKKPRRGAPKKITKRGARALVHTACQDTRMTLKALATPSKSGKRLNYYTVAIYLKSFGKAKR